jgi:Mg2+ and Co2+ transporter CorA
VVLIPAVVAMDADESVFEQLTAIVARLEMHIEQLTIHVDGLKNHTFKDEIASEMARIGAMSKELDRLKKLKQLYANRLGNRVYTHH